MRKALSIAGAGAWVIALALDFGSAAWPEIIKPHPHLVIALGVVGAIMVCAPLVQYFFPIFEDEVFHRLDLKMHVDDVRLARAVGELVFLVSDVFLLVSAELLAPRTNKVSYALQVLGPGKTVSAKWEADISDWCKKGMITDTTRVGDVIPIHAMDSLPTIYVSGAKHDGWLHFRIPLERESELGKSTFRLMAISKHGNSTFDKLSGTWSVIRKDFKIVKKPGCTSDLSVQSGIDSYKRLKSNLPRGDNHPILRPGFF